MNRERLFSLSELLKSPETRFNPKKNLSNFLIFVNRGMVDKNPLRCYIKIIPQTLKVFLN